MNILMLSAKFPYPATLGGTQIRTFYFLKALSDRHNVTLLTVREPDISDQQIEGLKSYVQDLILFDPPAKPPSGPLAKAQRLGQFLLNGTPANVTAYDDPKIRAWIDQAVAENRFDAITCEHSVNAVFIRPEYRKKLRTVINVHSSETCTIASKLALGISEKPSRDRLLLPLTRRYETNSYRNFTDIVVTTNIDDQQIRAMVPTAQPNIIPNGVLLEEFTLQTQEPANHQLIFTGTFDYSINIDTARHLALDILPRLQERYPDVSLAIVGSKPDPTVQALTRNPNVIVTGRVPSLADWLHQSLLFVAPMRSGFGIKNKTLEAMAAGLPIVGSDRALEGLLMDEADAPGTPLRALRANDTDTTVAAICRLFEDADLRSTLAKNARHYIEEQFTWSRAGEAYCRILERPSEAKPYPEQP